MSNPVTLRAEQTDAGFWVYIRRSAGEIPEAPLHHVLTWIIEQLNFGQVRSKKDSVGDVVAMTIGRAAPLDTNSADEALEDSKRRLLAVSLNRLMAKSREGGIEPAFANLARMAAQRSTEWGHRNPEFHYAFELTKVLARLNKKAFVLEAPPVKGVAPESVLAYLSESTRCWLYGFHGATVALSRACLEDALRARLPPSDHGPLDLLIGHARRRRILDDLGAQVAHSVRMTANKFLHRENVTESQSRETLEATRGLIEQLF